MSTIADGGDNGGDDFISRRLNVGNYGHKAVRFSNLKFEQFDSL